MNDLDQAPTCLPGGTWWSGMHCLHVVSRDGSDAQCCGCTEVFPNPSSNLTASATQGNYRLGAIHVAPGPFWPHVKTRMPEPQMVTV